MTKVCIKPPSGEESSYEDLHGFARAEKVTRIIRRAQRNGVLDLLPEKILRALKIESLETAELHQLEGVETMLDALCIYCSKPIEFA